MNIQNLMATYLAQDLDESDTSLYVPDGTAVDLWVPPALVLVARSRGLYDLQNGEIIQLDSLSGDIYNFTRISGTPRLHPQGELILGNIFAEHFEYLEELICLAHGNALSGVIALTFNPTTDLLVQQQVSPNMTVKISPGYGFINRKAAKLAAEYTTPIFIAPVSANRIDIVCIDTLSRIVIQQGVEGAGAPAVDADRLALAQILFTTATTTIVTGGITDARIFY